MEHENLDTTTGSRANLISGAENTNNKRFPTPVLKSVSFYQAFTPGVAGNKIPGFGEYLLADLLRFFQLPGAFFVSGKYVERISLLVSALKKRSNKKGTQVFSALIFGVPVVYPPINPSPNLDTLAGIRDNLASGAENTNKTTVSDSRLEVGLTISGFLPGVAGNKKPGFGEYLLADVLRFFQLPGAFFMPGKHIEASANKITALKKRSKTRGTTVFSALIFRVPMVYPLPVVPARPASVEGVAA